MAPAEPPASPRRGWTTWLLIGLCAGLGYGIAHRLLVFPFSSEGLGGHLRFGVKPVPGTSLEALRQRHGSKGEELRADLDRLLAERDRQREQAETERRRAELEERAAREETPEASEPSAAAEADPLDPAGGQEPDPALDAPIASPLLSPPEPPPSPERSPATPTDQP